jgi:hypothetical protein
MIHGFQVSIGGIGAVIGPKKTGHFWPGIALPESGRWW